MTRGHNGMAQAVVDSPSVDDTCNPRLCKSEYAVRGAISARAVELEQELKAGNSKLPFDRMTWCNLGNPQLFNQKPLSFLRQLIACCEYPQLLGSEGLGMVVPTDIMERSKKMLEAMRMGTYTASVGNAEMRKIVADGIARRDGFSADPETIFLTNGASAGVHAVLQTTIADDRDAFLVPVPQYPLYSAALALYGGTMLRYYLDEGNDWAVNVGEVAEVITDARARGLRVRGVVVINPGNPTGQVLGYENQVELLRLCAAEGIPIIADEVYQDNVWAEGSAFTSFRKAAHAEGLLASVTLFSLHSASKGFSGECGHRGGYLEALNVPAAVLTQMKKLMSISLCANTVGQLAVAALMSPPAAGEPSHGCYIAERADILSSLQRRARRLAGALCSLEGVTCVDPQGALYVFPQLRLPVAAHAAAAAKGCAPDFFYAMRLLEETGIVAVPGSGFGQAPGTLHLRLTILPREEDFDTLIEGLKGYHGRFMKEYAA